MDLKDFTDLGNDIGRRVNDAINNRNFDQLNPGYPRQGGSGFLRRIGSGVRKHGRIRRY